MPLDHNLVKTWFVSRAKPFATHFIQWIDACWFKGEKIPVADIDGLDTYLGGVVPPVDIAFTEDTVYTLPAGYAIYQIYCKLGIGLATSGTIRLGTDTGLDDLVNDIEIVTGQIIPVTTVIPAYANRDIYINEVTGISSVMNLRIYLHKI